MQEPGALIAGQPGLEHPQHAGVGAQGHPVVAGHVQALGFGPCAAAMPPAAFYAMGADQKLQRALVERAIGLDG